MNTMQHEDFSPPHFHDEFDFTEAEFGVEEGLSESTEPLFGARLQPASLEAEAVHHWLAEISELKGFMAAVLIDTENGQTLGARGDAQIVESAHATVRVVKAIRELAAVLDEDRVIEEVTTVRSQMHLLQSFAAKPNTFIFVAFDHTNIGSARHQMGQLKCAA